MIEQHEEADATKPKARSKPVRVKFRDAATVKPPTDPPGDVAASAMSHVRGAPYHPLTQGKIERWHQALKNRILLENYYLPGDLKQQIAAFVDHYNHGRYHESLDNLTPADVYFGRGDAILLESENIKRQTMRNRRL